MPRSSGLLRPALESALERLVAPKGVWALMGAISKQKASSVPQFLPFRVKIINFIKGLADTYPNHLRGFGTHPPFFHLVGHLVFNHLLCLQGCNNPWAGHSTWGMWRDARDAKKRCCQCWRARGRRAGKPQQVHKPAHACTPRGQPASPWESMHHTQGTVRILHTYQASYSGIPAGGGTWQRAEMTASGLESSLTSKAYFFSTIFSAGKLEIITNQRGQQAAASQTPFVGWCWGSKREVICPKSQSHSDLPLDSKGKGKETSKNEAMSRKEKNTPQAKILWNKYRIF